MVNPFQVLYPLTGASKLPAIAPVATPGNTPNDTRSGLTVQFLTDSLQHPSPALKKTDYQHNYCYHQKNMNHTSSVIPQVSDCPSDNQNDGNDVK
jgi:hypothetical protein